MSNAKDGSSDKEAEEERVKQVEEEREVLAEIDAKIAHLKTQMAESKGDAFVALQCDGVEPQHCRLSLQEQQESTGERRGGGGVLYRTMTSRKRARCFTMRITSIAPLLIERRAKTLHLQPHQSEKLVHGDRVGECLPAALD